MTSTRPSDAQHRDMTQAYEQNKGLLRHNVTERSIDVMQRNGWIEEVALTGFYRWGYALTRAGRLAIGKPADRAAHHQATSTDHAESTEGTKLAEELGKNDVIERGGELVLIEQSGAPILRDDHLLFWGWVVGAYQLEAVPFRLHRKLRVTLHEVGGKGEPLGEVRAGLLESGLRIDYQGRRCTVTTRVFEQSPPTEGVVFGLRDEQTGEEFAVTAPRVARFTVYAPE